MAIVPLSCANCGAPLEAPEYARFLTCGHCGSRLRQERSGSAVYTELVDQVAQVASSARDIAEGVSQIAAHHRIEALDREWEETRQGFVTRDKEGHERDPGDSVVVPVVMGIVTTGFGIFWMGLGFTITADAPFAVAKIFPFFGLIPIVVGLWMVFTGPAKVRAFQQARADYQRRRQALLREIEKG